MRPFVRPLTASLAGIALTVTAGAQPLPGPAAHGEANERLGLRHSQLVDVAIHGRPGESILASIDDRLVLRLHPRSVRSPGYRLLVQLPNGDLEPRRPGIVRTLRGELVGAPGSDVAGAWLGDGLHARIAVADGSVYWLQPAGRGQHALYRGDDVVVGAWGCGTDRLADKRPVAGLPPGRGQQPSSALKVAELACDADFEYFSDHGGVGAVEARINAVIGTMNGQYESQVGITHQIGTIIVRTSASQPYTSTDAVTLLNQFRDEWNANRGNVQRDVAHLFTGKEIDGGTIGIAWIGVICNQSFGYGLVQSDFNNNFACATDLSAHELGHNWSADHCGCRKHTMNSFITCANKFNSRRTIPEIVAHRDSRTCLSGGGNATSVHVASITVSSQGKKGRATVVVVDDLGAPVSGATVDGTFSGDASESVSGTTGADGSVTLQTGRLGSRPTVLQFCVDSVSASLPYTAADNVETCDNL